MVHVTGRAAFVTGAANGIGLGIARALALRGVRLGLADLDGDELARAAAELGDATEVEVVEMDVRDRSLFAEAADRVEARFGPVTLLINNAGVAGGGDLDDLNFDLWDWNIGINLGGVVNGVQTFLPRIRALGLGGHVVNTASASGLAGGTATMPYCTAKAAVVGLSESLRAELKGSNIGVSLLCPGPVATAILSHSAAMMPSYAGSAARRDERMSDALRQGVSPDEVGRTVVAAMERGEFYIHTDGVMRQALDDRHREIMDAMPQGRLSPCSQAVSASLAARRSP